MKIVVVSGAWCTGKTRMANELSRLLDWPVFSFDFYKEKRFDQGETGELDDESYDDLFRELIDSIECDRSCIIESDFTDEDQAERLLKIAKDHNVELVQVYLFADAKVLIERFIHRLESGERHSGHQDEQYLEKAKVELNSGSGDFSRFSPLELPGTLIKINTSDFGQIDYDAIADQIKS